MPIHSNPYGKLPSGESIDVFTLFNPAGMAVKVITYGGIVTAIEVPDRSGELADVVLGKPDLEGYLAGHPYMGAITGRVAGRITNGRFSIEGKDYELIQNNGKNHLHGGAVGFDKVVWKPTVVRDGDEPRLRLDYEDPDGHNGYPGRMECVVEYSLTLKNELVIDYHFASDRTTPFAVTNHSYFNLRGEGDGTVLDHEIQILSDETALADEDMTLLDQRASVDGQANDFREPAILRERVDGLHMKHGDGYYFRDGRTQQPRFVARFKDPASGRVMETLTTEPYGQVYTSAMMDAGEKGKTGVYVPFSGICLETQAYPNTVNAPHMGDGILQANEEFHSTTIYRFSAE
ncbi:MAG: aldose epimerase family protein [Verrucomicrobiota bacterium]